MGLPNPNSPLRYLFQSDGVQSQLCDICQCDTSLPFLNSINLPFVRNVAEALWKF